MCQKYDRLEDALICMSDLEKIVLRVLLGYIFVNDSLEVKKWNNLAEKRLENVSNLSLRIFRTL